MLMQLFRRLLYPVSYSTVVLLKPIKLFAYDVPLEPLRRLILAVTAPIDFGLIWLNIQDETMLLHQKVYGGNFIFGHGVMVTDHATTSADIVKPTFRGNNFMGVGIVASESAVFATNAPILNQSPPVRASTRHYLDTHVFTPPMLSLDEAQVRKRCAAVLDDWLAHPRMADRNVLRSAVTRVFLKLLSDKTVTVEDSEAATRMYIRRFLEFSLFGKYLPFVIDVLGSHKSIRKDAYFKLKAYDIDVMTIDITLFAAMFSVGTVLMKAVEYIRRFHIPYADLSLQHKRNFVIEVLRLYPTVTSVHRIIEEPQTVRVCHQDVRLTAGDEIVYPFVCSNRDPAAFPNPLRIDLNRPAEEYERVLSWSKGPHSCPAKEMSILVTVVMLDTLARRFPLHDLVIDNPTF